MLTGMQEKPLLQVSLLSQVVSICIVPILNGEHYNSKTGWFIIISANELYDGVIRAFCDAYAFGSDTMSRIVSFDGIKTSIYRWKSEYVPLLLNEPNCIFWWYKDLYL